MNNNQSVADIIALIVLLRNLGLKFNKTTDDMITIYDIEQYLVRKGYWNCDR